MLSAIVNKYKIFIEKNDFVKSVSILVSGTALSQIIVILSTTLLTRIYTPEEFGLYSVYLSILFSISVVASLLYEMAIPLPSKDEDAINLLCLAVMTVIAISTFVCVAILFFHSSFVQWVKVPQLEKYLWLLPVSLVTFGIFQVLNSWALRKEEYSNFTKSKISMNVSQVLSQISFGFFHFGTFGLLMGEVVGRFSGSSIFTALSWKGFKNNFNKIKWTRIRNVAVRYKHFPLVSSWSAVINSISFHIPTFYITAAFGAKVAGLFLLAQRILAIPEALLGYSVKQVYIAKSAKLARVSFESFTRLFWQTIWKMTWIGLLILGGISLVSPYIFGIVFGRGWEEAGVYLQCLSLLYLLQMNVGPILANFYVLECQRLQLIGEITRFTIMILVVMFSSIFLRSPIVTIVLISVGGSFGYIVLAFFSWLAMKKRFQIVGKAR